MINKDKLKKDLKLYLVTDSKPLSPGSPKLARPAIT